MQPQHKDLIIELMAEEIVRLRLSAEGQTETIRYRQQEVANLNSIISTGKAENARLISELDASRRENLRLDEKRLEALNRIDAAEAKASRLEAALAKSKKGLQKKAK